MRASDWVPERLAVAVGVAEGGVWVGLPEGLAVGEREGLRVEDQDRLREGLPLPDPAGTLG